MTIIQKTIMVFAVVLAVAGMLCAADSELGTWARTDALGKGMTMKIEVSGLKGRRLTYSVPAQGQTLTLILDSSMDGTEAPVVVNGKSMGQTMALTKVDDHHYTAIQKINGQLFMTSKGTFSADFNTLTVEDEFPVEVNGQRKQTENWVRK